MEQITEPVKTVIGKEDFLAALSSKTEVYRVKALGGMAIKIRQLSGKDAQDISSGSSRGNTRDASMANALTIIKGVVEPKMEAADVERIATGASGAVVEIASRIWKFSGVGSEEEAKND